VLPRRETEPGAKLATAPEDLGVGNRRGRGCKNFCV
jgi:hypothetical protein